MVRRVHQASTVHARLVYHLTRSLYRFVNCWGPSIARKEHPALCVVHMRKCYCEQCILLRAAPTRCLHGYC